MSAINMVNMKVGGSTQDQVIKSIQEGLSSATSDYIGGSIAGKYTGTGLLINIGLKAIEISSEKNSLEWHIATSASQQIGAATTAAIPISIALTADPIPLDEAAFLGCVTIAAGIYGTILGFKNYYSDQIQRDLTLNSPDGKHKFTGEIIDFKYEAKSTNNETFDDDIRLNTQSNFFRGAMPDDPTEGPDAYTSPDEYQRIILQEHIPGPEYYLNITNTGPTTDTTWLDFLTPDELAQLQTADADGTVVPSAETIAELRMVGEVRMAEQTANLDKTTGETNIVDPTCDGALNLTEGWEQADYAMIQAVLAAQKDGDASATAEQANQQYQEYNSSMVSAGNSAYGIYNAAQSGDGLALAQNTLNLVTSIDKAVDSYLKLEGGGDGFLTGDISGELGKIGAGLNFAGDLIELTESIGSGDADKTHDIVDYRLAA